MSQFGDFLPGLAGATRLPRKAYVGRVSSTSDLTTYTFSSANLGSPDPSRVIALCVYRGASGSITISSITVAGINCSFVVNTNESDAGNVTIAYVVLPTGSTGDIVVTFSGAAARCGVDIYNLFDLASATPLDGDMSDSGAGLTLTTQADGILLCCVGMNTTGTRTFGGTGITTDADVDVESGHLSSGSAVTTTTSLAITTTGTQDFCAGSWR